MNEYTLVRTIPVMVTVHAENEDAAAIASGDRLDDWMSDAVERMSRFCVGHDKNQSLYSITYYGDTIKIEI